MHSAFSIFCRKSFPFSDNVKKYGRVRQAKDGDIKFNVCVTVHHWYNNVNNQLDATITNFIDNYNQLNMFRAIISPILRRTRLGLQFMA